MFPLLSCFFICYSEKSKAFDGTARGTSFSMDFPKCCRGISCIGWAVETTRRAAQPHSFSSADVRISHWDQTGFRRWRVQTNDNLFHHNPYADRMVMSQSHREMHSLKFQTRSLTVQINGITRNRLTCFRIARKHNHCDLLIVGLFVLITISAAKKNIPGASCGQYHCQCGMRNGPTL